MILGHRGMLGHMVKMYLEDLGHTVHTNNYRFPSAEFNENVLRWKGDYIVNAIGAIPQKKSTFEVNKDLPVWLSQNSKARIIHAGTDCEIDNDEYGNSKREASEYIKHSSSNTKILKASIIGPELSSFKSLLSWFLNSEGSVNGYSKAMWNGVTTLEWSKQCNRLMNDWESYEVETIIEGQCLSKYELLELIKEVFDKNITIIQNDKIYKNKCLTGAIVAPEIKNQLEELKKYYYEKR